MLAEGKKGVRVLVVGLLVLVGVLAISVVPALADETPEAPEASKPVFIKTTATVLEGVLNPGKTGSEGAFEANEYFFLYDKSSSQCTGGGSTPVEIANGEGKEHVEVYEEGLEPETEYTACLVTRSLVEHKEAKSPPVTFKTREVPVTLKPEEPVAATTATLRGTLDPNGEGEPGLYKFEYSASATECGTNEAREAPEPEGIVTGQQDQPVVVTVSDLAPATTYTVCLVTYNSNGAAEVEGAPVTFTTSVTVPAVTVGEASEVSSTTATISASIDPDGLSTSYHAEYVTDAQFEASEWAEAKRVPVPDAELPAANTAIAVSESLAGLAPATGYHFRFTATNSASSPATVFSSPAVFTTATSVVAVGALPDNRAYELVSTSGSAGELYMPPAPYGEPDTGIIATHLLFHVAPDGERVTYLGGPSFSSTSSNGSVNSGNGNQWLATRAAGGWSTEDISVPGTGSSAFYQGFSSDLATAVLLGERQPLAPGVTTGCTALYARSSDVGNLTPLLTGGLVSAQECGAPQFRGASEGGSQVIFESTADLAPPAREGATKNLFESSGGHLEVVNALGNGEVPNAAFASKNAISRDGTRIFWVDIEDGHLFVLEDGAGNVQVSGTGSASFLALSPNGQYAYYEEEGSLRRFSTATNTSEQLEPSTVGLQGVVGASEDGSYVYFVAEQALAPGATARTCQENSASETEAEEERHAIGCNLYVSHEGRTSFIASLSPQDGELEVESSLYKGSDWSDSPAYSTAEVTPGDGNLVFESVRGLAGYGSRRPAEHYGPEVFVYSAASRQIACASCTAAGGVSEAKTVNELTVGGVLATEAPTWISSDGSRVFFESTLGLVGADTNGVEDVYEWEREGAGSCTVQVPARPQDGCVYLLSGGESSVPSFLVGADASGDNVFFTHAGPLAHVAAPEGQNELYDARAGGGFVENSLACSGTGCQGAPPAAPTIATPPSVTFSGGSGNYPSPVTAKVVVKSLTRAQKLAKALRACAKDKNKLKRATCQAKARKKYGAKTKAKQRKAGNRRGAKS